MESKQTFGQYIRDRRRALGLTQREFAETLYARAQQNRTSASTPHTMLPRAAAHL